MKRRLRAWLALALLAPVPSLAVTMAMIVAPGPVGHALFVTGKVWILALPGLWFLLVEGRRPRWVAPTARGAVEGTLLGLAMAAAVALAFLALARQLDPEPLRAAVEGFGFASPGRFLLAATYWVVVNSLIEEYVYRWFVLRQATEVVPPAAAVLLSATIFTAHHVIAVKVYLPWGLTVLASAGIFTGGVLWAWLFLRHRSLWSPWLSHIAADIAVFAVGWHLLFPG